MPSLVRNGKTLPHNLEAEGAAVATMTFTLHNTDAIGCAELVADESVHAIVTSPPYYGLRRYAGVPDLVWGGDPACVHKWGDEGTSAQRLRNGQGSNSGKTTMPVTLHPSTGFTCIRCNAWRGQLGAEPTPDLYVAHLVDVFRAWRPKLHRSGVCVVNLGDSYGKGKNLLLIPHRFALAMQADGWVLRNECPWVKTNAMPSSVTDRLTVGHEWFLLFAKEQRYYWDAGAVRRDSAYAGKVVTLGDKSLSRAQADGAGVARSGNANAASVTVAAGRNLRTSDVWLDGLDATIAHVAGYLDHLREIRDGGGLLTDPAGEPLALYASTKGTDAEHYAAYGAHLVTPWVRAGTPPGGTVADPFAGTGTTLEVAIREGRNAIGCEPSTKYYPDAVKRLESVAAQSSLFAAKIDVKAEARTIEQLGLF